MRALAILLLLPAVARAEGDAITQGAALAGEGRYKDAIVHFKQARLDEPRRSDPDCLIALAYRRIERWGQAKLFLTRCLEFPSRPEWVPQLVTDIEAGIAQAQLVPVRFAIEPATGVTVTVGSFAPDEKFVPQPIFLEPGAQVVTLEAAGHKPQRLTVDVTAGTPYEVKATLEPDRAPGKPPVDVARPVPPPPVEPTAPAPGRPTSKLGYYVLAGSGAFLAIGVVSHVLALGTKSDAEQTHDAYVHLVGQFETQRNIALGSYAVAAIGAGVGAWLLVRARHEGEHVAQRWLAPTIAPGAAGVAWGGAW